MSTAVTVKLCHSTVNNRSITVKLCAHSTVNNMYVASEATMKWNQREREKEKEVCLHPCGLVLVKTAGRASGPGRQDCGRREASLRPHRWRCCAWFWWCGALLCWQLLSHLCFWDQPSGQCFSRSCRHCFVAVDVGHPLCGLHWPGHLVVVVVLLAMFRFAFVVRSSRLRATQVSPIVVGAGLHAGQVLFPSAWCVLRHHRFVWESLK